MSNAPLAIIRNVEMLQTTHDYRLCCRFASECTPFTGSARVQHEFVRVECRSGGTEVYRDFHGFVRLGAGGRSSSSGGSASEGGADSPSPPPRLNILLLGADNLSRLNLLRNMPRVTALLDRLGAITMQGYNKVRDSFSSPVFTVSSIIGYIPPALHSGPAWGGADACVVSQIVRLLPVAVSPAVK